MRWRRNTDDTEWQSMLQIDPSCHFLHVTVVCIKTWRSVLGLHQTTTLDVPVVRWNGNLEGRQEDLCLFYLLVIIVSSLFSVIMCWHVVSSEVGASHHSFQCLLML